MTLLKFTEQEIFGEKPKHLEYHYNFLTQIKSYTKTHAHDFYELAYIMYGRVYHQFNKKADLLNEGDLILIRPNDVHGYSLYENEKFKIINLAFTRKLGEELFVYLGTGFESDKIINSIAIPKVSLSKKEKQRIIKIFDEFSLFPRNKIDLQNSKARRFIFNIISSYFSPDFISKNSLKHESVPFWLNKLYVDMHEKQNFTAGMTAMLKLSGKTQEHICRQFKKHYNKTPTEFINELKLNLAANLLENSDYDITDVAFESGFESLSYFYQLFKKEFGTSPGVFRKNRLLSTVPQELGRQI